MLKRCALGHVESSETSGPTVGFHNEVTQSDRQFKGRAKEGSGKIVLGRIGLHRYLKIKSEEPGERIPLS
jgi:hypothetical protein